MNQTQVINYALDLQYTYNIKLMLLCLFAVYSLYGLWYFKKFDPQYLYQYYFKLISNILAKVYLFVGLPFWLFFLSRNVPIDTILRPMLVVYGLAGVLFVVFIFLGGAEWILKLFTGETFWRDKK